MKPEYLTKSERKRKAGVESPDQQARESTTNTATSYESTPVGRSSTTAGSTYHGRASGVSTEFLKHNSAVTFEPRFMNHRSKNQTTLEYINSNSKSKLETIIMDPIEPEGDDKRVSVSRKRNLAFRGYLVLFLIIGVLAGSFATYFLQTESNAKVTEETEEIDFCAYGDQNARDLIAAKFNEALSGQTLDFTGKIIECIPDDAFSALSEDQRSILSTVTTIRFVANALEKIANKAFIAPELERVTTLFIRENGVSDLGDDFLASLPNLEILELSWNAFVRLNSEVFRNSRVKILAMSFNPLLEVPNALSGAPEISYIIMNNCAALRKYSPNMFQNTTSIISIDLSLTALSSRFYEEDVAAGLGVNRSVLVSFE